jgi:hypothetical protein
MSSNEKKMKKQCKVFAIAEKISYISGSQRSRGNSGESGGNVWFVGNNVKHDGESKV